MSLFRNFFVVIICVLLFLGCIESDMQKVDNVPVVYSSFGGSPVDDDVDMNAERKYSLMEREIEYLMDIWEGDYDNVEQLTFESDRGMKDQKSGQHRRIHSTVSKIKNEHIGEYLLYVKEYTDNNPLKIFREFLYKLTPEDSTAQIRVKMFKPKTGKSVSDISKLSKLKISSFSEVEECDILIHREGRSFVGKTNGNSCGPDLLEASSLAYHLRITDSQYGFKFAQDEDAGKSPVVNENWYMLDKSRCFVCMIDFPREEGGRPVETKHYIEVHDQGGQFEFDYTDGRHMVLTMRNTWSYGMKRNTFVIVLQEESLDGKVLIYSWGADGADRIGMNPGWIRVQCDIKNGKNADLQQRLRPDS